MTKDDKQFFKGIVNDLEVRLTEKITGLESGQAGILSRLTGVESGLFNLGSHLSERITELDTRLSTEIRHNGVLMEKMQGDIDLLVEGNQAFHQRIGRLEEVAT